MLYLCNKIYFHIFICYNIADDNIYISIKIQDSIKIQIIINYGVIFMILAAGVSTGVGISKAKVFKKYEMKMYCLNGGNVGSEFARIDYCIEKTVDELKNTYSSIDRGTGNPAAYVFDKYINAISSPEFRKDIKDMVAEDGVSAEYAIASTMDSFKEMVRDLDDEYLCERAEDIEEIKRRLICKLTNDDFADLLSINEECIVVAEDLTPGEVLNMDTRYVKGIVTILGGPTSSVSTIARYMNIPLVAGVGHEGTYIKNGDLLIVDGNIGKVIVNPDDDELKSYGAWKA